MVLDTPQTVKADVFLIEKVVYEETPRMAGGTTAQARTLLAATSAVRSGSRRASLLVRARASRVVSQRAEGTSPRTYATHLRPRSKRQPEVRASPASTGTNRRWR